MFSKNNLFYLILFIIFFSILELLATNLINTIKDHHLIIKSKNFYKSKKLTNEFKEYLNLIPYIDDSVKFKKYIDEKSSKDLFYYTFKEFSKENTENILIQGDSWAAAANKNIISNNLKNYVSKKRLGLINAGKISYSISPMNVQLDILLKKFNLRPSKVIAIIDQTDIGDELHRYQSLSVSNLELTDTRISFEFKDKFFKILESEKLGIFKIFILSKEFWNSRYIQFDRNIIRTINYCFKRLFYLVTNTQTVLAPLKYGISDQERKIIEARFTKYINFVFDNNVKKLIFVSHPHKNHLKNNYKINISSIIDSSINKSKFKSRIIHINFNKKFEEIYSNYQIDQIFIKEDPTSHLQNETYEKKYFPYIFSKCCS